LQKQKKPHWISDRLARFRAKRDPGAGAIGARKNQDIIDLAFGDRFAMD
jgi:hypothetical protein